MTSDCRRVGCTFDRETYTAPDGSTRRSATCSKYCYVWDRRAIEAVNEQDAKEAAKLLRLAELLDARESASETVPGLMRPRGKHGR